MSVISTVHSYIDTDPDLLFRVAAANYTLSIDQIAAVLMQIKDQQEAGHLVTLQCIKSMKVQIFKTEKQFAEKIYQTGNGKSEFRGL